MQTLKWSYKILDILGFSLTSHWTSLWRRALYNSYGMILVISLHFMSATQMLDLFNVTNQEDFVDNLYVTLVFLCDCCKTIMLLRRRGNIAKLIDELKEEPFATLNAEETEIQRKFMQQIERNTITYALIIDVYVVATIIISFFTDYRHGGLKFRAWLPYDYSSPLLFTVTYVHQMVVMVFATNFIVACDSLFSGLLVNIYCQFELLEYRLKNVEKFATAVNEVFTAIISIQFIVNTFALCFNHYRLSQLEFGAKFGEAAAFMFCVLAQIFYYCWYGNEVKLKSLTIVDVALDSTLMSLDNSTKKMFLTITMRAMEPIQFTSIHIVSMNLESFITLVKTSYSAYTMLQQMH
nr:PREDICTED: odorant receptor 45a [Megachile rotundata]